MLKLTFDCGLLLDIILCSVPPVKHRSETVKPYCIVLNIEKENGWFDGKGLKSTWSGLDDGSNKNSYEHCDVNTEIKTCGRDNNTQTGVVEKQPASPVRSPAYQVTFVDIVV